MSPKIHTLAVVEPVASAPAENLKALANDIRETYAAARQHAQLAIAFAVRVGILCDRAKAALPHGKFESWLEENGIAKTTAHRDRLLAKSNTMLLLPADQLAAPDFLERVENDKKFRNSLVEKVHEVAGESTVTDVMKDLGIIKPPANVDLASGKRVHYPAAKAKKLSPEQVAKQNRAAAKALFVTALSGLQAALGDKNARRYMEAKDWTDVRRVARDRMKQLDAIADKAEAAASKGAKS